MIGIASAFVDVLRQYHENPVDTFISEAQLPQAEFDELMNILSGASLEDTWNLQMALNFLNELPECLKANPLKFELL